MFEFSLLIVMGLVVRAAILLAARARDRRRDREVGRLAQDLALTDDELELLEDRRIPLARPRVEAWRRARLLRLAGGACSGMPGIVHTRLKEMIDVDPARAAAVLDDDGLFRAWVLDEVFR